MRQLDASASWSAHISYYLNWRGGVSRYKVTALETDWSRLLSRRYTQSHLCFRWHGPTSSCSAVTAQYSAVQLLLLRTLIAAPPSSKSCTTCVHHLKVTKSTLVLETYTSQRCRALCCDL